MSALTFAAAHILRVLPRQRVTRFVGKLAERRWSPPVGRAVVGIYSRAYHVSFDECVQREGWDSFDAFFTRELRAGARPLDPDDNRVLSPADGRLESMGRIEKDATFLVKGQLYSVEELVGDPNDAERYVGGGGFVVYLSPRDYHRVHAPVSGTITTIRSMPGDYYPVNAIGMRYVPHLLVRNRRVAIAIETAAFGRVTVVMVAAMVVGRITVTGIDARDVPFGTHALDLHVERGGEIGQFHLGSTAVVLLENTALERWLAVEGPVRYGQAVAEGRASVVRREVKRQSNGG
jgi:phosphatidylserine decarboxylase